MLVSSCEPEEEIRCYPERITRKIATGSGNNTIIADYKYIEDTLDHIVRSDFQTHYYKYNDEGQIAVVSRKNVQTYQDNQSRYSYDGGLLVRSDEYRVSLDRFTQEELDAVQTGYREFFYNGKLVMEEKIYQMNDTTESMELTLIKSFKYDPSGNITEYAAMNQPAGDTIEAYSYSYDLQRNPFSSMDLVFDGESHVNNIVEKTDLLTGEVASYQVLYNPTGFPNQVNIKLGDYISEIITIDYSCR